MNFSKDNTIQWIIILLCQKMGAFPWEYFFTIQASLTHCIQFRQIVGAVMMIGSLAAAPHLSKSQVEHSTCVSANTSTLDPIDLTLPTIVMVIISSISALAFVIFFDTPYKRLNAEKIAELEESSPADERPINDRHTNVI